MGNRSIFAETIPKIFHAKNSALIKKNKKTLTFSENEI